ncbi:MAG: GNAT family N-acetyltransferase [Defluviitaleaceae bacterium]|nr:GNAT family N-acetyltransferase [Defluviitaleaceae bacterium]
MSGLIYREIHQNERVITVKMIQSIEATVINPNLFIRHSLWEIENLFDKDKYRLLGCYDGDMLIGMSILYLDITYLLKFYDLIKAEDALICEISWLVDENYRGRGIATALARHQFEYAKNVGYDYLFATAHDENAPSIKIIEALGLELIKRDEKFDGYNGREGYIRNVYVKKLR